MGKKKLLLVSMPLADRCLPNLAIEVLASLARANGISCDVLYGTLFTPSYFPHFLIHSISGPVTFTPSYFKVSEDEIANKIADLIMAQSCHISQSKKVKRDAIVADYLLAMDGAREVLSKCMEKIPINTYDIVGFSVGFDAQKLPSACLSKMLKEREPGIKVLWGGTGCDDGMGVALLKQFSEIDAVLANECENTFLPAVNCLSSSTGMENVPNLIFRKNGQIVANAPDNTKPGLSATTIPDYSSFLKQCEASEVSGSEKILLFETSRGCWWGKKHHCTFCGIEAVDHAYRSLPPDDAIRLIKQLYYQYRPDLLYSTDAILNFEYFSSVLPELKKWRDEDNLRFELFYEIKSTIRKADVKLLSDAGVKRIQPGIESFSANTLKRVKKGANPLQQIELLKWMEFFGIIPIYGLLSGVPGETEADVQEAIGYMNLIHHLPPPVSVNKLGLHRFSPYYKTPKLYNIGKIRPFEEQKIIYQSEDEDALLTLCYEAEYELEEPAVDSTVQLKLELEKWRSNYRNNARMLLNDLGNKLLIIISDKFNCKIEILEEQEASVYRMCEEIRNIKYIASALDMKPDEINIIVHRLSQKGLMAVYESQCLALATRSSNSMSEPVLITKENHTVYH